MKHLSFVLLILFVCMACGFAHAGDFATGGANETPNAPDAGIPARINGEVNPIFKGWVTDVHIYAPAPGVVPDFRDTSFALGPPHAKDNTYVVSLGDLNATQISADTLPGSIVLTFAEAIYNGIGADFAVFENGFFVDGTDGRVAAEFAYVEVSTDGEIFSRFPSISDARKEGTLGYEHVDVTDVYNLAGKHVFGYGTPFDLDDLLNDEYVRDGLVDLNEINYVRLVDIPGSGDFLDSRGEPIYDMWVSWGSGGFDLTGIGVINTISDRPDPAATTPEPSTLVLFAVGLFGIGLRSRRQAKPQV